MPFKNDGVQVAEYVWDFDVDGGAVGKIILSNKANKSPIPVGAIIKSVVVKVLTAVTTSDSGTLAVGNGDNAAGYVAATAAGSLTDNALFNGWDVDSALLWDGTNDHAIYLNVLDANDGEVSVTIATGALTAGKVLVLVEYYYPSLS